MIDYPLIQRREEAVKYFSKHFELTLKVRVLAQHLCLKIELAECGIPEFVCEVRGTFLLESVCNR